MKITSLILLSLIFVISECKEKTKEPPIIIHKINDNGDETLTYFRSLSEEYQKTHNEIILEKLNNITCQSDGFVSEGIETELIEIYNSTFNDFTEYLYKNNGSCLEKSLIRGIGASLFTKDKDEKILEINNMSENIIGNKSLKNSKKKYILSLIDRVNYNELD